MGDDIFREFTKAVAEHNVLTFAKRHDISTGRYHGMHWIAAKVAQHILSQLEPEPVDRVKELEARIAMLRQMLRTQEENVEYLRDRMNEAVDVLTSI